MCLLLEVKYCRSSIAKGHRLVTFCILQGIECRLIYQRVCNAMSLHDNPLRKNSAQCAILFCLGVQLAEVTSVSSCERFKSRMNSVFVECNILHEDNVGTWITRSLDAHSLTFHFFVNSLVNMSVILYLHMIKLMESKLQCKSNCRSNCMHEF